MTNLKTNHPQTQLNIRLGAALAGLCLAFSAAAQTITWQENWESPVAQDNWYADNGYWEIGVPTYGPPDRGDGWKAHQGTNVAATVLGGNYTDDRESRLISSPFSVPPANQNPRLRFWHWWSFNACDYGQVQISTNNGVSWVALSPNYAAGSSGNWTRAWLDLTPYAGRIVRLGFFFHSHSFSGCGGIGPGWYVDETVVESGPLAGVDPLDSFEDAAASDRWSANFGIWEIGVPTSGPGSAHSGSNCLATILSGSYTDDRESRVSSQTFVVPTADLNPRLRFWHWWSFGACDFGQVQISTNNGVSWFNLSGQYSAGSSGRWSRGWLDLTPYEGQTVRLGFFIHAHSFSGCGGVGSGWYVDELTIETGSEPSFSPSENFETDWAGWKADYIGGKATDFAIWEIGVPTSGPGAAHAGTNVAATVLNGNYPDDRDSRLVSPPFVVPTADLNPRLRFWHWWSFGACDFGQVQISTNNGASWIALATYSTSSPWTRPQLDLIPYAGQTARLGFYFHAHSFSGCGGVGSGWYVDEVRLLHDPSLSLVGSPVVRTQDTGCVSLAIAVDSPASGASFVIEAAAGNLNNAILSTEGCWSGTITSQSATEWLVNLQSSCTTGSAGAETIGTICFTAVSPHSAFVPLTVNNLVISNLPPAQAFGTRAVNIANEPLLEAWLDTSGKRMATTYGKANTSYEIRYSTDADAPSSWLVGWSNTVPAGLVIHSPVGGVMSNAPVLFLKAREQSP